MRAAVALLITLAAAAAAAGALLLARGEDRPAAFSPAPISWSACGDGAECGTLEVPLDHEDPGAGTIRLAVARRSAADPARRLGVLVAVPGGPGLRGAPGVRDYAGSLARGLRDRFDLVGWDARGFSEGTEIVCLEGFEGRRDLDPIPDTEAELERHEAVLRRYAESCSGELLPHLSTVASARDLDLLRRALGEEQLTLAGTSYGTALSSVYATLFPTRVRGAVLDAAYDLTAPPTPESVVRWARAHEEALDSALARCAADESCPFHSGGEPAAALDRLLADLEAQPLRAEERRVGADEALLAIKDALSRYQADSLFLALFEAERGAAHELRWLADEALTRRPLSPSSYPVICRDRPPEWFALDADARAAVREAAPRLGRMLASPAPHLCTVWQLEPDPPPRIDTTGAGPILVVGSTGDVVTPLYAAEALVERLDRAALLVAEHDGHGAYGVLECVTAIVDRFLVELELPPARSVCEPGRERPRPPGG